jgi:hypothetical protein
VKRSSGFSAGGLTLCFGVVISIRLSSFYLKPIEEGP